MNRFYVLVIALVVSLAAAAASAQSSGKIYIPFAFTANHQMVPAGSYKAELLSDRYLALINEKTGRTETILMVRPDINGTVNGRSALVFHVSGHRYYLKEVKFAGTNMRSQLAVQPKVELQVAKDKQATLEVAMK